MDLHNSTAAATTLPLFAIVKPRRRVYTRDEGMTFDRMTMDSTGAFLINELERLDLTMHDPLVAVTWQRDIKLREDVTIADEASSYTNNSFASSGGQTPTGKAWISSVTNAISGVAVDIGKTSSPLPLWGLELKYSIPELESSQKLGRPIDATKYQALMLKYNMDVDEQVYIGDTSLGVPGLVNNTTVPTIQNVPNGAGASPLWVNKTPDEMLDDVNSLLNAVWAASAWAVMPGKLGLPPTKYSYLVSQKVSSAGNQSILQFLKENSLCNSANGVPLDIQPMKWLTGRGSAGADRMIAYTNEKERVRFPLVPLQRTPIIPVSIYQQTTYFGRLGVVEFPYRETVGYADGI